MNALAHNDGQVPTPPPEILREKVVALLEENRLEDTLAMLRVSQQKTPGDVHIARGIQLLECKLGQTSRSFGECYEKAVAAHLEGDHETALQCFGCCRVIEPNNATIVHNMNRLRTLLSESDEQATVQLETRS